MQGFDKVLLIANPLSGGGGAGRMMATVATVLRRAGHDVQAVVTRQAGDARAAARSCRHKALLVVFGGDGTFNEALNGADLARCTLGLIPAGTGNVLAKELGMCRRPLHAAAQLQTRPTRAAVRTARTGAIMP